MRIPEYPPILFGTPEEQIRMLREYLMRLAKISGEDGPGTGDAGDISQLQEEVAALQTTSASLQTQIAGHTGSRQNPHEVTAAQTGAAEEEHTHTTEDITDFPELAEVAFSGAYGDLSGTPELAEVATSGDYNDLLNRPVIPPGASVDTAMSDSSENAVQNKVIKAYVDSHSGGGGKHWAALDGIWNSGTYVQPGATVEMSVSCPAPEGYVPVMHNVGASVATDKNICLQAQFGSGRLYAVIWNGNDTAKAMIVRWRVLFLKEDEEEIIE